jgi:hypothetical protein
MGRITLKSLKANLLGLVASEGSLDAVQCSKLSGYLPSSCRRGLRDLKDAGALVVSERVKAGNGSMKLVYSLSQKQDFPHMSGGEYLAWRPSGTNPMDIDNRAGI